MDKSQKIILASLIIISAVSWVASKDQSMMEEIMLDSGMLFLFTAVWTVGMAAMMFPAISPMVLLYKKLITNNTGESETGGYDHVKLISFVGSYLAVWTLTGIVLLVGWSILGDNFFMETTNKEMGTIYGIILIISGAYQFSPLKTKCLGYCESPATFFMRRWKSGFTGSIKMGTFHGLYCLGCCWPYFLLMIALGWMNLVFMGLFAAIIFGEKIWSKGIWVSRMVGIGFIALGLISMPALDLNILFLNSEMM
jgi:predicted metal-binding membrane protein